MPINVKALAVMSRVSTHPAVSTSQRIDLPSLLRKEGEKKSKLPQPSLRSRHWRQCISGNVARTSTHPVIASLDLPSLLRAKKRAKKKLKTSSTLFAQQRGWPREASAG